MDIMSACPLSLHCAALVMPRTFVRSSLLMLLLLLLLHSSSLYDARRQFWRGRILPPIRSLSNEPLSTSTGLPTMSQFQPAMMDPTPSNSLGPVVVFSAKPNLTILLSSHHLLTALSIRRHCTIRFPSKKATAFLRSKALALTFALPDDPAFHKIPHLSPHCSPPRTCIELRSLSNTLCHPSTRRDIRNGWHLSTVQEGKPISTLRRP